MRISLACMDWKEFDIVFVSEFTDLSDVPFLEFDYSLSGAKCRSLHFALAA
jgi:hypothetical protein